MAIAKGEEYWAKWSFGFCQMAKVSINPARDYSRVIDMQPKSVSATVHRMREQGFIVPTGEGHRLTPRSEAILQRIKFKDEGLVAFDLHIRARTKELALAEVWDVINQLEHWDPRTGEPFKLAQARHKMLGPETKPRPST